MESTVIYCAPLKYWRPRSYQSVAIYCVQLAHVKCWRPRSYQSIVIYCVPLAHVRYWRPRSYQSIVIYCAPPEVLAPPKLPRYRYLLCPPRNFVPTNCIRALASDLWQASQQASQLTSEQTQYLFNVTTPPTECNKLIVSDGIIS